MTFLRLFLFVFLLTSFCQVVVHLNNIVEAGCLGKKLMIHDLTDSKGKGRNEGPQKKRRAKILGSKQTASIRIDLKKPICLELFSDFRQLGRFTMRDKVKKKVKKKKGGGGGGGLGGKGERTDSGTGPDDCSRNCHRNFLMPAINLVENLKFLIW